MYKELQAVGSEPHLVKKQYTRGRNLPKLHSPMLLGFGHKVIYVVKQNLEYNHQKYFYQCFSWHRVTSLCFRFVTLKRQQPWIRPQHSRYSPEGAVVQGYGHTRAVEHASVTTGVD